MKTLAQRVAERIVSTGDLSPGNYNLAADILWLAVIESEDWINTPDDAVRIPDMLYDAVNELRLKAENIKDPRHV